VAAEPGVIFTGEKTVDMRLAADDFTDSSGLRRMSYSGTIRGVVSWHAHGAHEPTARTNDTIARS